MTNFPSDSRMYVHNVESQRMVYGPRASTFTVPDVAVTVRVLMVTIYRVFLIAN